MNWKWASRVGFMIVVLAVLGLLWRRSLFAGGWVMLALQLAALALMLWARKAFGRRSFHASASPTEGGLVITGPYRFIRHPIYAAILLFFAAGLVSHPSIVNGLLVLVAAGATGVRIVAEERLVTERYPEYGAYAARTKRVIPFVI